MNIYGGEVEATGGKYGSGIGGGEGGNLNGTVNIYGGTVTATGGEYASGIGGGQEWRDKGGNLNGKLNISGGSVTATGGDCGAGIGGGGDGNGAVVNISGGKVDAYSRTYGAGIGGGEDGKNGTVNISGGEVSAKAKTGCGIGCGWGNNNGQGGDINITGGIVEAASVNGYCAGIGGGGGDNSGGDAGNITIRDAVVVAGSSKGAGIGGGGTGGWGNGGNGGKIVIDNSAIFAMSGKRGAGIGGGEQGSGGNITIHDSYVEAVGGHDSYNYYKDKARIQSKFMLMKPDNALSNFAAQYDEKIADLILYYLLSGEWGGSGIGGGVNGNGGNITITGTSSVISMGGMSGASAIGHGTGKTENGTLTIPDGHWVKAGTKEDDARRTEYSQRINGCHNNQYAMVLPACEHTTTAYRSVNNEYHEKYCKICGDVLSERERHDWNSDIVCTVCRYSSDQTEIAMKLRGQGGLYKQIVLVSTNLEYVLPECPEIPSGREFIGWRVNGGEYKDVYMEPGDIITPTEMEIELTAVYYVIKDTDYINEWGEKNTIPARRINPASTTHNVYLTTGWYSFGTSLDIPENIVFIIDGNVNLILPDGCNINFDTACEKGSFSGDSLSIFGQEKQTGVLNFNHSDRTIHSLASFCQYGGNINAEGRNISCGGFNMKRGIVRASKLETFKADILGGRSAFGEIYAFDLTLGWTGLDDSISLGTINTSSQKLTITDEQALKDGSGNNYSGTVSNTDAENQTLTPYLEHSYGEPEWLWENDSGSVQAKFTCTDEGCGKVRTVDATVRAEEHGAYITYTAVCDFYGKTYTASKDVKTKWNVVVRECEGGIVTASKNRAEYGDKITLDITPDEGYVLTELYVVNDDDKEDAEIAVSGSSFTMPAGKVVISATFMRHYDRTEPYTDDSGAYIAGNVEYFEDTSGQYYLAAGEGKVGERIDPEKMPGAVSLSYFVFLPYRRGWQITKYNGPLNEGDVLCIPETYDGKPIVCLGRSNPLVNSESSFSVKLNKNVAVISTNAFNGLNVTEITGDTSALNTIMLNAFANAGGAKGGRVGISLEYPGMIQISWTSFLNTNVTFRLKHATTLSDTSGASSVGYIFTDGHIYGDQEPEWLLDSENMTASATFVCTDERCGHRETIDVPMIVEPDEEGDRCFAEVTFEGRTYTTSCYKISGGNFFTPDPGTSFPEDPDNTGTNGQQGYEQPETGDVTGNAAMVFAAMAIMSFVIIIYLRRRKDIGR